MAGIIPFTEEDLVPAIISIPAPWGWGKGDSKYFFNQQGLIKHDSLKF